MGELGLIWGGAVSFTHRSIPKFLEGPLIEDLANYLKGFDFVDAFIQTSFAFFKSTNERRQHYVNAVSREVVEMINLVRDSQMKDKTPYSNVLMSLTKYVTF